MTSPSDPADLNDIRAAIDEADKVILKSLAMRFKAVDFLRRLKKIEKLPIVDFAREAELKQKWKSEAKKLGLREELALLILDFILHESKRIQEQ